MTKIFIKSSHATLEYDQARMFVDLGFAVGGDFDVGSQQRPKIIGATDRNTDVNDSDLIVLHQTERFEQVMESYLRTGKKVILVAFGQGDDRQHSIVSNLCKEFPHQACVAAYSNKDFRLYKEAGCPENQLELIRFGKYKQDYKEWRDNWPVCFATCNSIHKRGIGCGWHLLEQIAKEVPIMLGGKETQETDLGLGELNYMGLPNIYSNVQCHLSLGTQPAPMTLTLIDAFMSGTPVVAYNNTFGIVEEGFDITLESTVEGLIRAIKEVLSNKAMREEMHHKSLKNSQLFDVEIIGQKWKTLIERI